MIASIDDARFSVRSAQADRTGAQAALRHTVSETAAATERAYWALVAVRLAVGVKEEAVKLAEEQLQQTQLRIDSGAAPRTELAQPKAELERRRDELLSAREIEARAENGLKLQILAENDPGWNETLVPSESIGVEVKPVDVQASLNQALATRPELAQAGAALERRQVETKLEDNRVRPSLDAVASYDRFGQAGTPLNNTSIENGGLNESVQSLKDNQFNAARLALVLGLPIRNSSARATAESARHVQKQAEAELALTRKNIRAQVLDAAAALETAGQRIEAARSGRGRPRRSSSPRRIVTTPGLDEFLGAHAAESAVAGAPRRALGPDRLPRGADRNGPRGWLTDRIPRHRRGTEEREEKVGGIQCASAW